jgi:hypothetical protein
MTHVEKNDTVYIPFKLIRVGDQHVLVPDSANRSFIKNDEKRRFLSLHSGHISQIYVCTSHIPLSLIKCAQNEDYKGFSEIAHLLGHQDIDELYVNVRNQLQLKKGPNSFVDPAKIDFNNDHGFFDSIFE